MTIDCSQPTELERQMCELALEKGRLIFRAEKQYAHWKSLKRQQLLINSRLLETQQELLRVDRQLAALDGRTTECKPKRSRTSSTKRRLNGHQKAEQAAIGRLKAAMSNLPQELVDKVLAKYEQQI